MIDLPANSDSDVEVPDEVGLLAEEFLTLHRQGQQPDVDDYCFKYPEFASRIRDLFPMLLIVEQCGLEANSTTTHTARDSQAPMPDRIGDFQIIREVGRGGMGIVYEAEQQSLGRRVALKVLPPSAALSPSTIERFRRESRAAARLHHSNIVPVFGVGEHEGTHYYVMQFIHGVGLDQVLVQLANSKRSGLSSGRLDKSPRSTEEAALANIQEAADSSVAIASLSTGSSDGRSSGAEDRIYWNRVALIGMQLSEALHFAHSQGVLHRDLKPANVLLDTKGMVWLTDFGLAHATDDLNLTRSGDIVGTLRYLAPERLRGDCSRQSDVYGLGMTLYELVTFVPAFSETERAALLRQVIQQDPKRPRSINRNIPRDLETIILKSIEKDASHRYVNASELADDLSRFLNDRPIRARRVIMVEQFWRWCRRNPTVAALSSAVGMLLLGLSFAWVMISFVRGDRDRARAAQVSAERARSAASRAELLAKARTHLAAAIGHRHSVKTSRKVNALSEIDTARAFEPPDDVVFELRNEAIAAMAQTDVKDGRLTDFDRGVLRSIALDCALQRVAWINLEGAVTVSDFRDAQVICRIPSTLPNISNLQLSARGKYVVLGNSPQGRTQEVWDVERNERVLGPLAECFGTDFNPQETELACYQGDGSIHIYNLSERSETRELAVEDVVRDLDYTPDGSSLAICFEHEPRVQIWDVESSRLVQQFSVEGEINDCSWHPSGDRLALACKNPNNIELWDVAQPKRLLVMVGHTQDVIRADFSKRGDYLSSGSWDGTLRIWQSDTSAQVGMFTAGGYIHGGHETVLALQFLDGWLSEVETDRSVGFERIAYGNDMGRSKYTCGDTSPNGRILFAGSYEGLECWDVHARRRLASVPYAHQHCIFFDAAKQRLLTVGDSVGMQAWPISGSGDTWQIGRPETFEQGAMATSFACRTLDGERWALIGDQKVIVLTSEGQAICEISVPTLHDKCELSPNGRLLATFGWHSPRTCIWDTESGLVLHEFACAQTTQTFNLDSTQLITGRFDDYVFRDTDTWEILRRIKRTGSPYPSHAAFSNNGSMIALELTWGNLHLLSTDDYRTLAVLESPYKGRPTDFQFIGQNNSLFAFHHLSGEIQIWRIDELRQRLKELRLDWKGETSTPYTSTLNSQSALVDVPNEVRFLSPVIDPSIHLELSRKTIEEAERLLTRQPDSQPVINYLAWELVVAPEQIRNPHRAIELLEAVRARSALEINSRNTLAIAYYRIGKYAEAIELLRDNLQNQLDAYLGYDLYFLAMSYWQVNERQQARDTLQWAERMLRLKPPLTNALTELERFRQEALMLIEPKAESSRTEIPAAEISAAEGSDSDRSQAAEPN